jgi:hypothetical protein
MVAKVICGKNIRGALAYNEAKVAEGLAECIYASGLLLQNAEKGSLMQKANRFAKLTTLNPRVKTNAVHISLNFHSADQLSKDRLREITDSYMDKIGFGHQPYVVYEHTDAAHPHLHIITTNIQSSGKRIDLHNIGRVQSEAARKQVEEQFSLLKAEHVAQETPRHDLQPIEPVQYGKSESKRAISNIIKQVTKIYNYTSLPELNAVLGCYKLVADQGYEGTAMFRRKGLVYSIIDSKGQKMGVPVKSSRIDGSPTLKFLEGQFKVNKLLRKRLIGQFRNRTVSAIAAKPGTLGDYGRILQKERIDLVLRKNKEGKVYGLTYVDHLLKCVLNGSDLGKRFTANGVLTLIETPPKGLQKRQTESAKQHTNEVSYQGQGNRDVQAQVPQWLIQISRAEQMHATTANMSIRKRRRRKKKGRSI